MNNNDNLESCASQNKRIADLKQKFGLRIVTDRVMTPSGKRVAQYKLAE